MTYLLNNMQLDWWSSIGICEREMHICLSIIPLYVPNTRGVRVRLESRDRSDQNKKLVYLPKVQWSQSVF